MNSIVIAAQMWITPLLPIGRDSVLIESAIELCKRSLQGHTAGYKESITVVVSANSPIPAVLRSLGWHDLQFVYQPGDYGVTDAITRGALSRLNSDNPVLITFADELYNDDLTVPEKRGYYEGDKSRGFSLIVMRSKNASTGRVEEPLHEFLDRHKVRRERPQKQVSKNLGDITNYTSHLCTIQGTV